MSYLIFLATLCIVYTLAARGAMIVSYFAGITALCLPVAFAIGAYAFAVVTVAYEVHWLIAIPVSGVFGALSFLPLVALSARVEADLLTIATLAYQQIFFQLIRNIADLAKPLGSLENLTNGTLGITGTRIELVAPFLPPEVGLLIVVFLVVAICELIIWICLVRPHREMLLAVKDDPPAARDLGLRVLVIRGVALSFAGSTLGVAGALYAGFQGYIDPDLAGIEMAFVFLAFALVGSRTDPRAIVLGPLLVIIAPELLRMLNFSQAGLENVRVALSGVLIVVLAVMRPWQSRRKATAVESPST